MKDEILKWGGIVLITIIANIVTYYSIPKAENFLGRFFKYFANRSDKRKKTRVAYIKLLRANPHEQLIAEININQGLLLTSILLLFTFMWSVLFLALKLGLFKREMWEIYLVGFMCLSAVIGASFSLLSAGRKKEMLLEARKLD